MDKGRTQTNETKDKETNDDAQSLLLDRIIRLYVSRKEEGRGLASIKDCVNVTIQTLMEWTEKAKEE